MKAAKKDNCQAIELLVAGKADVNAQNKVMVFERETRVSVVSAWISDCVFSGCQSLRRWGLDAW